MKLPNYLDLAIIGAGVQALTLTTHLLQKSAKHYHKFLVFDPSQTWLSQWQQQFAAQKIPYLRSPAVHHPDPNPHQLRTFAEHRHHELFPPYDRPGTATNLRRDTLSEKESSWGWDLVRGTLPRTKAINSTISPVFFRSLFPLQKRPLTNCQSES